jgi:hypothetical protein
LRRHCLVVACTTRSVESCAVADCLGEPGFDLHAWIAQTRDLSGQQRMLRDLDGKIALQEVDDFSTMLRGHVAQLLAAIRNSDVGERGL